MVSDNLFTNLQQSLESLDANEWTMIKYDDVNFIISFIQRGKVIDCRPLQGLVKIDYHKAILSPAGLRDLRDNLSYLIRYPDVILISPKNYGFTCYGRDSTRMYDRPTVLCDLDFYSVKNPILLFFLRLSNKRIKRLMHF